MNVSHTPSEWVVQHVVRVRMRLPEVEDASERVESAAEEKPHRAAALIAQR